MLTGVVLFAIGAIVASNWISKSRPVLASNGPVTQFGVHGIPDEETIPLPLVVTPQAEPEKPKKAKAPPLRKSALGMASAHDNPSESRASREVASWNPSGHSNPAIANRRQSALGN
jgi:hypothetical protein